MTKDVRPVMAVAHLILQRDDAVARSDTADWQSVLANEIGCTQIVLVLDSDQEGGQFRHGEGELERLAPRRVEAVVVDRQSFELAAVSWGSADLDLDKRINDLALGLLKYEHSHINMSTTSRMIGWVERLPKRSALAGNAH